MGYVSEASSGNNRCYKDFEKIFGVYLNFSPGNKRGEARRRFVWDMLQRRVSGNTF